MDEKPDTQISDSVVMGDIHQTNISNVHHHSSRRKSYLDHEEIRIEWIFGNEITKLQFFVVYFVTVSIIIVCFIASIAGVPFFRKWAFFLFIPLVAFTINAVEMRQRFRAAEMRRYSESL